MVRTKEECMRKIEFTTTMEGYTTVCGMMVSHGCFSPSYANSGSMVEDVSQDGEHGEAPAISCLMT